MLVAPGNSSVAEVLVTVSDYAPPGFRTKVCHMCLRFQEDVL